jgi:hypothetical protein
LLDLRNPALIVPMGTDKQIEEAAEKIWTYLKSRQVIFLPGVRDFSPASLWVIERFFEMCSGQGPHKAGSPFDVQDHKPLQFQLGAYIGEVVCRYHGEKCTWGDEVQEDEIELHLPDGKLPPLFPMRFIGEQLNSYKPGSIIEWGTKAGLSVGKRPRPPVARFRP